MKVARVNARRDPILSSPFGVGGGAAMPALDDLTDVDTSGAVPGDTIVFDGTDWLPGAGSGSDVPWSYAQADGGLAGDGTTDDTVAFQAWLATVTASGTVSGWFWFEPGVYLIGGALQDTGAFNGQILLPNVSTSSEQITLTFQGNARPPYAWHGTTAPVAEGYSVIKSTLTGASGTAAVISAGNGTPPAQNNISVVMENLIFLGPDNPTFTFLNLKNVQGGAIRSIQIATAGGFSGSPVQPTHSNSYGIKLSQVYNSNYTYVDGISVGAYYTGVLQGELSVVRGLVLGVCIVGIELPDSIHASLIVDMHQSGCPTGIKATGLHYCDILQYDAEHYVGNVTPFPTWMNPIYDLDDGSNNMHGHIRFLLIDNDGSGPAGWSVDHTFVKNGGSTVSTAEIGPLSTGASFATPSIALGTAAAAGAASTVIRSDSTIVAFDATVPTTIAFSDAAATGSATVAARRDHRHGAPAAPSVTGGTLVIASSHSTPLIFGDLVQTSAGDDLIYSSI